MNKPDQENETLTYKCNKTCTESDLKLQNAGKCNQKVKYVGKKSKDDQIYGEKNCIHRLEDSIW